MQGIVGPPHYALGYLSFYTALVGEPSIAISLSVCLSVREHISGVWNR